MSLFFISIRLMTTVLLLALICGQWMTPAWAFQEDENFTQRTPVSAAALDRMRGGFQNNPNDPIMSFGIERSVFLNGKTLFRGRSAQNFRDPGFLGIVNPENDTVYLPLKKGSNELVLALSELGGGWGFICRVADLEN